MFTLSTRTQRKFLTMLRGYGFPYELLRLFDHASTTPLVCDLFVTADIRNEMIICTFC